MWFLRTREYIIGRKSGIYLPGIYLTYIPKNTDEGYRGPHYMDILRDELFRCTIRKSFESSQK
jgi:hypothetical protein